MALRDFIKKQETDLSNEEAIKNAVQVFEKNCQLYKGKSDTWNVRITADELGIHKEELCEMLDKYYGSNEKPEE